MEQGFPRGDLGQRRLSLDGRWDATDEAAGGQARHPAMGASARTRVDHAFGLARTGRLMDRIHVDLAWVDLAGAEEEAAATAPWGADQRRGRRRRAMARKDRAGCPVNQGPVSGRRRRRRMLTECTLLTGEEKRSFSPINV